MKHILKQFTAVLLIMAMCLSLLSAGALATESGLTGDESLSTQSSAPVEGDDVSVEPSVDVDSMSDVSSTSEPVDDSKESADEQAVLSSGNEREEPDTGDKETDAADAKTDSSGDAKESSQDCDEHEHEHEHEQEHSNKQIDLLNSQSLAAMAANLSSPALGTLTVTLVSDTSSFWGHAFLVIRNDTALPAYIGEYILYAGEQATLGLRPGDDWLEGFGGAYINVEAFQPTEYSDFSYITCVINQEQLTKIAEHFRKKSSYAETKEDGTMEMSVIVHNCTTAASEAWNMVCPLADTVVPDNIPADLKLQINLLWGSKKGTSLSGSGLVDKQSDDTKIFYMNKSGDLIPIYLGETLDDKTVTAKTDAKSITLNWQPVERVKNQHTRSQNSFANGYAVSYHSKEGQSGKVIKFIPDLSTETYTLNGLDAGQEYSVILVPVYKYTADGKTAYSLGNGYKGDITTNEVTLNKHSAKLQKGKSITLSTTVKGTTTDYPCFWGSLNPEVASVDSSGTITAWSEGTTTISVTYGGSTDTCKVSVTDASIQLNKTSLTLSVKKTKTLKATVKGPSKKVTWKSDNTKVATVDKNGKVTAKKKGKCTITATANGVSASCKVKVLSEKEAAIEAYREYLSAPYIEWKKGFRPGSYPSSEFRFNIFYLDNDSIPELMICNDSMIEFAIVSYKDGKIVLSYMFGPSSTYYHKKGVYVDIDQYGPKYGSYWLKRDYYTFSGGKAKKWMRYLKKTDDSSVEKFFKYESNKYTKIKKDAFEKALRKKVGVAKKTKDCTCSFWNTEENRNKYLK